MSIDLGKDASFTVAGTALTSVRSVSARLQTTEIECPLYGDSKLSHVFPGPRSLSFEVELLDSGDAQTLYDAMDDPTNEISISTHFFSSNCVVVGCNTSETIDGVIVYTFSLKGTTST